ncbi:MAG TPA: zf-HC2 domain-containing protein [Thermoanaerobaculia bacterium]|nr:zf-HC2 domain-containing protein [Thermoanaerobaculia bacterium]
MERQASSARRERLHERVSELIPWYVNGTLAAAERERVEEHLAQCAGCRGEAAAARELGRAFREEEEFAPSPHPLQLARLLARIDEVERQRSRPLRFLRALKARGPRTLLASSSRPVRRLVAAQAAALLLVLGAAGALGWKILRQAPPSTFVTLADPAPAAQIHVVFAEEASERQIQALLASVHGQIVAGPSPLGVYTLQVPAPAASGDSLAVVLDHLRRSREVSFVVPMAGGASGGQGR